MKQAILSYVSVDGGTEMLRQKNLYRIGNKRGEKIRKPTDKMVWARKPNEVGSKKD